MTNYNDNGGIGFRLKDEAAGEVPVAFVVRSNGSKISEDEIKQYISQQVLFNLYQISRLIFLLWECQDEFKDYSLILLCKGVQSKIIFLLLVYCILYYYFTYVCCKNRKCKRIMN